MKPTKELRLTAHPYPETTDGKPIKKDHRTYRYESEELHLDGRKVVEFLYVPFSLFDDADNPPETISVTLRWE